MLDRTACYLVKLLNEVFTKHLIYPGYCLDSLSRVERLAFEHGYRLVVKCIGEMRCSFDCRLTVGLRP